MVVGGEGTVVDGVETVMGWWGMVVVVMMQSDASRDTCVDV